MCLYDADACFSCCCARVCAESAHATCVTRRRRRTRAAKHRLDPSRSRNKQVCLVVLCWSHTCLSEAARLSARRSTAIRSTCLCCPSMASLVLDHSQRRRLASQSAPCRSACHSAHKHTTQAAQIHSSLLVQQPVWRPSRTLTW